MINTKNFRRLRCSKPGIALGLGYSKVAGGSQILVEGPLWNGASQMASAASRWHVGSITKSLTATAIMQQVDQKRLGIDQDIGEFLVKFDNVHASWQRLTIRQLLSHTSGLPSNPPRALFGQWRALDGREGRKRVFEALWCAPVRTAPGHFRYSNLGYMLAGLILEEIFDENWETILRNQIATPLKLKSLGFGSPSHQADPRGHRLAPFRLKAMEPSSLRADNPAWLGPAGTVHMSLDDLLVYGQAHLEAIQGKTPGFLSQSSANAMQSVEAKNYGLGWVVQNSTIWHNGSNTMWYAILVLDLTSKSVVVATQNATVRQAKIDAMVKDVVTQLRGGLL